MNDDFIFSEIRKAKFVLGDWATDSNKIACCSYGASLYRIYLVRI